MRYFSTPETVARYVAQFYLDNYAVEESQQLGAHLVQTRKEQGLTGPDIDVRTGIPWHHLESMEADIDHFPIRNLHLLARAMGKKIEFVDK